MSQPFRFVHCSDLHLECPLAGMAEPPAHLVDLLIDAPYAAAERTFELAITERVDFVVIAGDLLHVDRAGPRAVQFLLDQFGRLAARNIAVYWAGGRAERRGPWPADVTLPDNVKVFSPGSPQTLVHHADGDTLAVLVGRARSKDAQLPHEQFAKPKGGHFAIGVAHGRATAKQLAKTKLDYWAGGGLHHRDHWHAERHVVVYPGTPQGRSLHERGPHGVVVAQVDEHGAVQTRYVPTDVARYRRLRIAIDPAVGQAEQERQVANQVETVLARNGARDLFLQWQLVIAGSAVLPTSRDAWSAQWLRWLRHEFGTDSPAAWSISVDVVFAATPRDATDHPTDGSLLSDYLAAVDEFAATGETLPMNILLPAVLAETPAGEAVRALAPRDRRRVLRQTRDLGRDLLGAPEGSA